MVRNTCAARPKTASATAKRTTARMLRSRFSWRRSSLMAVALGEQGLEKRIVQRKQRTATKRPRKDRDPEAADPQGRRHVGPAHGQAFRLEGRNHPPEVVDQAEGQETERDPRDPRSPRLHATEEKQEEWDREVKDHEP